MGAVIAALALLFFNWRYPRPTPAKPQAPAVTAPRTDAQVHLGLIHLLDFAATQTTLVTLSRLIELASSPEVTDQFRNGEHSIEAQQARQWYIGYVGQELAGSHRRSDFLGVMAAAEGDAEHGLENTPEEPLPGETVLAQRWRLIIELQFRRAVRYLQGQMREIEDNLRAKRGDLIQRLNQRQRPGA